MERRAHPKTQVPNTGTWGTQLLYSREVRQWRNAANFDLK
jgi:hypothetical protein